MPAKFKANGLFPQILSLPDENFPPKFQTHPLRISHLKLVLYFPESFILVIYPYEIKTQYNLTHFGYD